MVKELINLLSQSSKLDEITVKHYLKLMKLDKLPKFFITNYIKSCLLYTSPSPRDRG